MAHTYFRYGLRTDLERMATPNKPPSELPGLLRLPPELKLSILELLSKPHTTETASIAATHRTFFALYTKYKRRLLLEYLDTFLTPATCFVRWFDIKETNDAIYRSERWATGVNPKADLPRLTDEGEWIPRLVEADELGDVQLEKAAGMHRRMVDIWRKGMGGKTANQRRRFFPNGPEEMLEQTPEWWDTRSLMCVYQSVLTQLGEQEPKRGLKEIWNILVSRELPHIGPAELNYRHQTFSLDARHYSCYFDTDMNRLCIERIYAFMRAVADKQGLAIRYTFRATPPKPWDPVREVARLFVKTLGPVMLHGLLYGSKEQALVAMHAAKLWIQADPEKIIYWAKVIGPHRSGQLLRELLEVCELLDYL